MSEEDDIAVVSDGRYWRLIFEEDKKHLLTKEISNQVKPDILTTVTIDVKANKDGKKDLLTSVSEVKYPKSKYSRESVEQVAREIAEKNAEADCPLCQKMKAAISAEEREKILESLNLPTIGEVLPELSMLLEPVGTAFEDMRDAITDLLRNPFDLTSEKIMKER